MHTDMDGKDIEMILFPGDNGSIIRAASDLMLTMSATYHGDRDEFWVIEKKKTGDTWNEVARHNARYIETIRWAQ